VAEEGNSQYGKITDEEVAKLRNRIGRKYPISQPYLKYVNEDSITHVARALGDTNPLYNDPAYAATTRFGSLVSPPAIFYALGWGSWDLRHGQGLPGVHGIHCGDRFRLMRPILAGDELHSTKELVRADPMEGRLAGKKMFIQESEIRVYNQREELVGIQIFPVIRAEREEAKSRGKYKAIEKATYTPEEIAQIDAELELEVPRGATPRFWEDTEVGSEVPQVIKGPLTLPDSMTWLMAMGSPMVRTGKFWLEQRQASPKVAVLDPATGIPQSVERVHWDDFMAGEIGMPASYDYGAQRGGYALYWATNFVGDDGWVAKLDVQYRGFFFRADVVRIKGTVVDKWRGAKTGTGYVKAEFHGVNQRGDDVMPGSAVFALPTQADGPVQFPVDVDEDGRA